MTTITLDKHKLIMAGALFATFIIGMALGLTVGMHHGYHSHRERGGNMMGNHMYYGGSNRMYGTMAEPVGMMRIQGVPTSTSVTGVPDGTQ
jgi:hypothetical protein